MGDLLKVLKEQKLVSDEKLALLDHNFSGIAKKLLQDQVQNAKVKNKKGNRYNLVRIWYSIHYKLSLLALSKMVGYCFHQWHCKKS